MSERARIDSDSEDNTTSEIRKRPYHVAFRFQPLDAVRIPAKFRKGRIVRFIVLQGDTRDRMIFSKSAEQVVLYRMCDLKCFDTLGIRQIPFHRILHLS
jgi:hypothetical protein